MKIFSAGLKIMTTLLAVGLAVPMAAPAVAQADAGLYGAYDPGQRDALWNEAIRLQGEGRHSDAIPILKRAAHLSRISDGLNAKSQLPYVRAEIQSYRAIDQLSLADERNVYLTRIEKLVLPSGREKIEALLRQAEWHQYALMQDLDDDDTLQARMAMAWNYSRRALNESIATYGENSSELLPALNAMVSAQYLLAGHRGVGAALPGKIRRGSRSGGVGKNTFKQGIQLLIAMQQLNRDRLKVSREVQADDLIRMGDWAWWTGNRRYALEFYGDALKLANGEVLKRGPEAVSNVSPSDTAGSEVGEALVTDIDIGTDADTETGTEPDTETDESVTISVTAVEESFPEEELRPKEELRPTEGPKPDEDPDAARHQEGSDNSLERSETPRADTDASHPPALRTQEQVDSTRPIAPKDRVNKDPENRDPENKDPVNKAPLAVAVTDVDNATGGVDPVEEESVEKPTETFPQFRILEEPVPLPAVEGLDPVFKVKTEPATDADLVVSFTVAPNGKVSNINRIQVPVSNGPRGPERVLRRLYKLRFRPVFVEGEPVESAPITWVFGPEHWAMPNDIGQEVSS